MAKDAQVRRQEKVGGGGVEPKFHDVAKANANAPSRYTVPVSLLVGRVWISVLRMLP